MPDKSKPKTTADRQRAYRARKAESGQTELRGVFAVPKLHGRIKRYAAKISQQNQEDEHNAN